jgi:hypothetical protein
MKMICTYRPDPAVLDYDDDPEYPCTKFWHSHSASFTDGRVSEPVRLVPFVFVSRTDVICTSYS